VLEESGQIANRAGELGIDGVARGRRGRGVVLLRPSSGSIRLFGERASIATRRRVGYVPQTLGLYAGLTVAENWNFAAAAFRTRRDGSLPGSIATWRRDVVGDLPLGVQRQVAFAVALSHQPELLVLDEPTSGAGPLASARLWEGIRQATDAGAGALVTTHNMEEAEQCDRLVIMAEGKVVAEGTADDITAGRKAAEIVTGDWSAAFALLDASGIPVQLHGTVLRTVASPTAVAGLLSDAGIHATVEVVSASLEEAFAAIVGKPAAGPRAA
jgi:ABC-2 type transport system ATP-binding protein